MFKNLSNKFHYLILLYHKTKKMSRDENMFLKKFYEIKLKLKLQFTNKKTPQNYRVYFKINQILS